MVAAVVNVLLSVFELGTDVALLGTAFELLAWFETTGKAVIGDVTTTEVFTTDGELVVVAEGFTFDFEDDVIDIAVALEFATGTGADFRACTGVFGGEARLTLDIGKVGGGGSELFDDVTTGAENLP